VPSDPGLRLRKWYLDLVTPGGDVLVAYWGDVRFHHARFTYSGLLTSRRGAPPSTRRSIRAAEPPEEAGGLVRYRNPRLSIDGIWKETAPPLRERLFESAEGSVDWECVMPRADAKVKLENGERLEGTGYVERLEMSIAPWKLPLDELRWGRWHGPTETVVWIDWAGPLPLTRVFFDGEREERAAVRDDAVTLPSAGAVVRFSGREPLREGTLGSTLLSRLPLLLRALPAWTHGIVERKWRGRGSLCRAGEKASEGWALYERVTFRKGNR